MILAIVLVLLITGSVLFHFLSPWYFTPIASNWSAMDDTISLTFWVTGFVFIAVNSFVAYCVIRFRRKKDSRAAYEPENRKLEWWLTGFTAVGVAAMLAPGLFVWANFVQVPADAAQVEVLGQQWHWRFRFPGPDGQLGAAEARLVRDENPFGMNPDDPAGLDDILVDSPQLHLPLGKPVKLLLRSVDVLHNFAVPQFRAKMDLVPGLVTYIWLTPTRVGTFDLLCEELCGIGHFAMRGSVVVEPEAEFAQWLGTQPSHAQLVAHPGGDAVAGAPLFAVCAACHGAQGEGNPAMHAPKLSGQGAWYLKRQIGNFRQGVRGAHEQDTFGKQMAAMSATLADDAAVENVSAYIATLPDTAAAETVTGNARAGQKLYVSTCSACHGASGHGVRSMKVPALAGMSDWYLVTQLKNFKQGVRGSDPHDLYGGQMAMMSATLADDRAIDDLVAYVNTLR